MLRKVMRYGASELRATYERRLGRAFLISAALHLAIALALFFTVSTRKDEGLPTDIRLPDLGRPDTISIPITLLNVGRMGGGGGSRNVDKPEGSSKTGAEDADPKVKTPNRQSALAPEGGGNVRIATDKPTVDSRRTSPNRHDTTKNTVRPGGTPGQHERGTGAELAGGNGGTGIGYGRGDGIGNFSADMGGRSWLARPTAKYPEGADVGGTVKLQFNVLPDGSISNIVPGPNSNKELQKAAIAGLRRAKARPLPATAPQVVQRAAITYTFVVK